MPPEGIYRLIDSQLRRWSIQLGSAIREGKHIHILSNPSKIDNHAAIFLASKLSSKTTNITLKLVGGTSEGKEGSFIVSIGSDIHQKHGFSITRENSLYTTVYTTLLLAEELTILRDKERITVFSSFYQNSNLLDEKDPVLMDSRVIGPLKVYRKFPAITGAATRPVAQALYQTLNPYYPSYTGKPLDQIRDKLRRLGIDPEKSFTDQTQVAMKKLVENLLAEVRKYYPKADAKKIASTTLIATLEGMNIELKELGEAIDIALEKNIGPLISHYSNGVGLKTILTERVLSIENIAATLDKVIKKEYEKRNNIYILECEDGTPISLVGDISRRLGLLSPNTLIACENRKGVYTTIYEAGHKFEGWKECVDESGVRKIWIE